MTHIEQPHAVDVIASGIHGVKNGLFDALARINAAAQSIRAGYGEDALPALAETELALTASTQRLSKLLSAYRLARHENPVSMLPVNVGALLEDTMLRVPQRTAIAVETRCNHDGLWVCDRELVTDCLVNALQNALRVARSRVCLEAALVQEDLALMVADDGPGFPPELPVNADGTRTGVGLYIADRIARLHVRHGRHGRLVLENGGPLGGAVFRFTLPG